MDKQGSNGVPRRRSELDIRPSEGGLNMIGTWLSRT